MLTRNSKVRIVIRPSFLLLLGLIFYLDDGSGSMLMMLAAAAVHEAGHVTACIAMGGRVEVLTLSAVGAELKLDYPSVISYGRENIVLLSGAAANLVLGAVSYFLGLYQMAYISVGLGVFNLLPITPLDGGRIFYNLICERFHINLAEQITAISSGIFIGGIAGLGAIWAVKFANWLPIVISIWLLAGLMRKKTIFS